MSSSKSACRKRRRKFLKKHPPCPHVYGSWEWGEVICNYCGKLMPL